MPAKEQGGGGVSVRMGLLVYVVISGLHVLTLDEVYKSIYMFQEDKEVSHSNKHSWSQLNQGNFKLPQCAATLRIGPSLALLRKYLLSST